MRAGFNYRLTEMQAIIAANELARLDSWNLARRRGFAKIYDHAISQLYGVHCVPLNAPDRRNAYWKYPLQLDPEKLACDPQEIREALAMPERRVAAEENPGDRPAADVGKIPR